MDRFKQFALQNWIYLTCIGIGVVLLGIGSYQAMTASHGNDLIVTAPSPSPSPSPASFLVDVQGAVVNPGVHTLMAGSRVVDALIAAGGMSRMADRSYVARYMNQAELVRDGLKIYIPEIGEPVAATSDVLGVQAGSSAVISINNASANDLDALWGIGPARAQQIIDNRPYASLEELVTKAKLTSDILERNQGKLGL